MGLIRGFLGGVASGIQRMLFKNEHYAVFMLF